MDELKAENERLWAMLDELQQAAFAYWVKSVAPQELDKLIEYTKASHELGDCLEKVRVMLKRG